MKNFKIRLKLMANGMRYYELDEILQISKPTRCRLFRKELPEAEQDRICKLIDEYLAKEGK